MNELRKTAAELYFPPFRFEHGYIWDSKIYGFVWSKQQKDTKSNGFGLEAIQVIRVMIELML